MELKSSYWYMQASPAQQKRVSDMLVSFRDTFTPTNRKLVAVILMGILRLNWNLGLAQSSLVTGASSLTSLRASGSN